MKKGTVAVLSSVIGGVIGAVAGGSAREKAVQQKAEKVDKFKSYYEMLNQWLILKQEGKGLEGYFKDNGYRSIAIYGMGEMGSRLYEELKNTDIQVKYAIDKYASSIYSDLEIYGLEDELPTVDVIVVTAIFDFDKIESDLSGVTDTQIISLDDIIYEI